jgi:hypothetical protein
MDIDGHAKQSCGRESLLTHDTTHEHARTRTRAYGTEVEEEDAPSLGEIQLVWALGISGTRRFGNAVDFALWLT